MLSIKKSPSVHHNVTFNDILILCRRNCRVLYEHGTLSFFPNGNLSVPRLIGTIQSL